jgi:probable phosphomutase (TIGR03848 family)
VTTTFYFVRHGLTSHTGHRLTGWMPDVHLTDEGRRQAEAAAQRLAGVPLKAVYTSPIDRTMETAEPIARTHGLRVRKRKGLGEVHYGKWTGRPFGSLVKTKLWPVIQNYPSGARFPDGETLQETQTRALEEIEKLRAMHPKQKICCVSHADVIKLIAAHHLGVHIDLFQRIDISPGSITVISIGAYGPRVHALNMVPTVESGR